MPNPSNSDLVGEAEPQMIRDFRLDEREWLDSRELELLDAWDALAQQLEQAEQREKNYRSFLAGLGSGRLEAFDSIALTPDEGAERETMGCGCVVGTHGSSLSEIAPHHTGNPWNIQRRMKQLEKVRDEGADPAFARDKRNVGGSHSGHPKKNLGHVDEGAGPGGR